MINQFTALLLTCKNCNKRTNAITYNPTEHTLQEWANLVPRDPMFLLFLETSCGDDVSLISSIEKKTQKQVLFFLCYKLEHHCKVYSLQMLIMHMLNKDLDFLTCKQNLTKTIVYGQFLHVFEYAVWVLIWVVSICFFHFQWYIFPMGKHSDKYFKGSFIVGIWGYP